MIVSVSKIYYMATINVGNCAGRAVHDTRVDHRKLCALPRRRVVKAIGGRSSADAGCLGDLGTTISLPTRSARRGGNEFSTGRSRMAVDQLLEGIYPRGRRPAIEEAHCCNRQRHAVERHRVQFGSKGYFCSFVFGSRCH